MSFSSQFCVFKQQKEETLDFIQGYKLSLLDYLVSTYCKNLYFDIWKIVKAFYFGRHAPIVPLKRSNMHVDFLAQQISFWSTSTICYGIHLFYLLKAVG